MKTIGKFTKTAIAVTVAGALLAPASAALAGQKTERAVLGAVIGGLAGAALGDGKTEAVAIGAIAGAALGASTAGDNDKRRYTQSYRTQPRYVQNRHRYERDVYGRDARDRYAYDRYGRRYEVRYDERPAYGYRR